MSMSVGNILPPEEPSSTPSIPAVSYVPFVAREAIALAVPITAEVDPPITISVAILPAKFSKVLIGISGKILAAAFKTDQPSIPP